MAVTSYSARTTTTYFGLSTDTKPTAQNGDRFVETDTQKVYVYNGTWTQITGANISVTI
jgi:hypothetical protein